MKNVEEIMKPPPLGKMTFVENPTQAMSDALREELQAKYERDIRACSPDCIILELRSKDDASRLAWLQTILDLAGSAATVDDVSTGAKTTVMVQIFG